MLDFLSQIPWEYPLLIIVGLVVGFVNTMAGGGSLLTLPILIFLEKKSSQSLNKLSYEDSKYLNSSNILTYFNTLRDAII